MWARPRPSPAGSRALGSSRCMAHVYEKDEPFAGVLGDVHAVLLQLLCAFVVILLDLLFQQRQGFLSRERERPNMWAWAAMASLGPCTQPRPRLPTHSQGWS